MTAFRAALLQMRSGVDVAANAAAFEAMAREAAGHGATYIQSPEMTGAVDRDRQRLRGGLAGAEGDPVVAAARRVAAECGVHVHVGSTAIAAADGRIANRAFLFSPGGRQIATYDKIHMFDVDLDGGESWRESATYAPGSECVVADIGAGLLGLAICYDIRFPQLFQAQANAGASVLSAPAAFTRQTGEAHWHVLQRARAIENGAFVLSAAQGGRHEDGRETYGHSLVVDPWGRVIAEAEGDAPGIVYADIDPALSAEARGKIPNLKNARTFAVRMAGDPGERASA